MDVIILAGGLGLRMGSELPKALIPIKNKPLISYQIDFLKGKIDNIILALSHKSEEIIKYIKEIYPDENIKFSVEDQILGTGGAVRKAVELANSEFVLVINCDDLVELNLDEIKKKKENTMFVANPHLNFGLVEEDNEGYAIFTEKPILKDKWVHIGWDILNKEQIIKTLKNEKCSLEIDYYPNIKLKVFKYTGKWYTFNSKKDIEEFEKAIL